LAVFQQLIPLYLTACAVEGKTDRTVQSYAETLRQFTTAVSQLVLPLHAQRFEPAHVYRFLGWVRDRGVTPGTQHRRQREVKAFFSWCRRMGYVDDNLWGHKTPSGSLPLVFMM
jgi:site-specific recombinase XerD